MRYSVLFFVLVNGMIRDSAITSTKAATTPEQVTETSSTIGTTAAAAAAAAPESTSTSALTSTKTTTKTTTTSPPPPTTTTQSSTTVSEQTVKTTETATTTQEVTTTPAESTTKTSGTMTATTTTLAKTTLTTEDPTTTTTNKSSIKPVSTTNQTTPNVTKTTPQPNTTTSDSRNVTKTTTNTDQQGSHSTTVTVVNETTTTEISTTDSRETTISSSDSSTSIATSTKQPDTTTKYPGETKDLSSLRINIDLQISLSNATYNESLKDRSSDIYIEYERSFRTMLYEIYEDISGFNHVIINNFSKGSVVCHYTVVVNADSNITDIGDRIANATLNLTNSSLNIDDKPFGIYVNETIVNRRIQNVKGGYICNLIDRACETFEDCSPSTPYKIHCTHKCYSGENVCHNGGSCFYDARKKSMECKCTKDNDYIYYGPNCIQKAEKFALHKNDIIGLAAGCGGGVVVILLVVIIVLLMKKTRKGKESDQKFDLSREVSIEDIRLHRLSESHSSNGFQNRFEPRAKPNPYETRMPETKFLHGRAHDIYKDSTGEETYIYPSPSYIHPISASGHRDSTKSGQSMYDYIDTESRFEIQRPRIRLGQSSAF